jgi:hypothetical protein
MDCEANARLRMRLFGTTFDRAQLRTCARDLLSDEAFLCAMEAAFLVREKYQTLDIMPSRGVRAATTRAEEMGGGQLRMWPGHVLHRRAIPPFGPQATP